MFWSSKMKKLFTAILWSGVTRTADKVDKMMLCDSIISWIYLSCTG